MICPNRCGLPYDPDRGHLGPAPAYVTTPAEEVCVLLAAGTPISRRDRWRSIVRHYWRRKRMATIRTNRHAP